MMRIKMALLAIVVGMAAGPTSATTVVRLSFRQLLEASSVVVKGRVVSQESEWTSDHTRIVTLTTLAVDEAMKGRPARTIVIQQPGGTVGNIHMRVPGTVMFRRRANYVLFLEPHTNSPSRYEPVGMFQGAYPMAHDRVTGQDQVILPLGRLSGLRQHARSQTNIAPSSGRMPFRAFRQQVASALAAPLVVPHGTILQVTIESTEPEGAGRLGITARTQSTAYVDSQLIIPAGSRVDGRAELAHGNWMIYWSEVSVRGIPACFSARSEEPEGGTLRGRTVLVRVK